jgi:hypothetical protein
MCGQVSVDIRLLPRVIVDEDGSQQEVRKLRWGRDDDSGFLVLWVCSVLEETFNNLITQRPR